MNKNTIIRKLYLCDGGLNCYGRDECRLVNKEGHCMHTTDISYAKHRIEITKDLDFVKKRFKKLSESEQEVLYIEV